jgi:hypothetical protein
MTGRLTARYLFLGLLAVGCRDNSGTPTEATAIHVPLEHIGSCSEDGSKTTTGYYGAQWACGTSVKIWLKNASGGSVDASWTTATNSASTEWNSALFGSHSLPSLASAQSTQPTGDYIIGLFDVSGGSNYFCGSSNGVGDLGTMEIDGLATSTQTCPLGGGPTEEIVPASNLWLLVMHEMGHVIGFVHLKEKPASYQCIMTIGTNPGFASAPCETERQVVYWNYSFRDSAPALKTAFTVASVSLSPSSGNILPGNQLSVTATTSSDLYSLTPGVIWSNTGSVSIASSSSSGATIQGTGAGSGTLTATVVDDSFILWPTATATGSYTTNVPPPSNLTIGTVTATSGVVNWTTGASGATTTVQDRLNGGSTWTTFGTVAAGITKDSITGLTACNTYDVNLYHTLSGQTSVGYSTLAAVNTPAASGVCAPTNFANITCTDTTIAGTTYTDFVVGWTRHEFTSGVIHQIGQNTTNNSSGATVIATAPSVHTSAALGPYLTSSHTTYYWWIRDSIPSGSKSSWTAYSSNPGMAFGGC